MVDTVSAQPLPQNSGGSAAGQGLEPGTELKARVEANMPGGIVRLAASDAKIDLRIPRPLPVGAEVTVTVSGSKQQPAVQLSTAGSPGTATPNPLQTQQDPSVSTSAGNPGGAAGLSQSAASGANIRPAPVLAHLVQVLAGPGQADGQSVRPAGQPGPVTPGSTSGLPTAAPGGSATQAGQNAAVPSSSGQPASTPQQVASGTPAQGSTGTANSPIAGGQVPPPGATGQSSTAQAVQSQQSATPQSGSGKPVAGNAASTTQTASAPARPVLQAQTLQPASRQGAVPTPQSNATGQPASIPAGAQVTSTAAPPVQQPPRAAPPPATTQNAAGPIGQNTGTEQQSSVPGRVSSGTPTQPVAPQGISPVTSQPPSIARGAQHPAGTSSASPAPAAQSGAQPVPGGQNPSGGSVTTAGAAGRPLPQSGSQASVPGGGGTSQAAMVATSSSRLPLPTVPVGISAQGGPVSRATPAQLYPATVSAPAPTTATVSNATAATAQDPVRQIARLLQKPLAEQQSGLGALFAQVGNLTAAQTTVKGIVPDPVVKAMQQILGLRLNPAQSLAGKDIQQAVRLSGQFREAQLLLPGTGTPSALPDLKSALLSLKSLLQKFGAEAQITRPANQPASPSRQGAPQGQAQQMTSGFWAGTAQQSLQSLLKETDTALARLRMTQLVNSGLASEDGPHSPSRPMDLVLELPLSLGQETAVMQMQIGRDGSGNDNGEEDEPAWRLRFALDLTATGPLEAAISLRGGGTYASLWVDRKETFDNLNSLRETMEAAFADAGLDLQEFRLIRGLPPKSAAIYGALIDRQS